LACVAACESGLSDPKDVADEYLGLAAGFLFSGAGGLVSALWPVPDLPTALLVERLYLELLQPPDPTAGRWVGAALCRAQRWVRNLTVAEVRAHFDRSLEAASPAILNAVRQQVEQQFPPSTPPEERPFRRPVFWAAFTASALLPESAQAENTG
jgi:CHAT domain-containing protein